MSSSPEPAALLVGDAAARARSATYDARELRAGAWTRHGGDRVLGDRVTEDVMSDLAARTTAAARAQGYATGWAEGRRAAAEQAAQERAAEHQAAQEAQARREAEHQSALAGWRAAADQLHAAFAATCARVEASAADLAMALTQELVGHELAVAAAPGADAVRRALALLPSDPVVAVRVSPDEAADPALAAAVAGVRVIADPALQRGDAVVETATAVVDARMSAALARVGEVLAR